MSDSDITFTVGLDTSEAEMKLAELDKTLEQTLSQDGADTVVGEPTEVSGAKGNNSPKDKIRQAVEAELPDALSRLDSSAYGRTSGKGIEPYSTEDISPKNKSLKNKIETAMEEALEDVIPESTDYGITESSVDVPREKDSKQRDLSEFDADSYGNKWSPEGSDAYSRLTLQMERSAAKSDLKYNLGFNEDGVVDENAAREAAERYARADGALQAERLSKKVGSEQDKQVEVTEEAKKQTREYGEQILKLGKIWTIFTALKNLISGIKDMWDKLKDIRLNATADNGFITKDFNGFMQSATDKRYSIIQEGIRNMGDSAPFSAEAFNSAMAKVEKERQNVLRGGSLSKEYVISTQWLKDKVGINLGAKELLTGSQETTTANMMDAVYKVEKYLSSKEFQNKSAIEQSQDMKAIRDFLGDEIVDGIAANMAANAKTGESITSLERIVQHGFSGLVNNNNDVNARKSGDALADLTAEFKVLLKRMFDEATPFFIKLVNGLKGVAEGVQKVITNKRSKSQSEDEQESLENARAKLEAAENRGVKVGANIDLYGESTNPSPQERAKRAERNQKLAEFYSESQKADRDESDRLREEIRKNPNKINELSASEKLEDVLNSNMLRADNVGSNDWAWNYEGNIGLLSMLMKLQGEGIFEKDNFGNTKIKDFGNEAMNELAKFLVERVPDKDTLESLSAGELVETIRMWANQKDAQTLSILNKLTAEGGFIDMDSSSVEGVSGYSEKIKNIVGEDWVKAAILQNLGYLESANTGGHVAGTEIKEKGIVDGKVQVEVIVHSGDPNKKSFSQTDEIVVGAAQQVKNLITLDLDTTD